MDRITALEKRLDNLQRAFEQSQRNQVPITAKAEEGANGVKTLTPYTETKTAYISDTDIVFANIPEGNMSVYVKDENGGYPSYTVERVGSTVTVYFEPLEYITTVTISIS